MRRNVEKVGDPIDFLTDSMRWQYQQLAGWNSVDNRPVKIAPVTEIGFNRIQAFDFEHFFSGLVFEPFRIKKELVPSSHRHMPGNREIQIIVDDGIQPGQWITYRQQIAVLGKTTIDQIGPIAEKTVGLKIQPKPVIAALKIVDIVRIAEFAKIMFVQKPNMFVAFRFVLLAIMRGEQRSYRCSAGFWRTDTYCTQIARRQQAARQSWHMVFDHILELVEIHRVLVD